MQCHRPTGNSVCGKRMIVQIVERSKKGNINKISNLFPISPLYEISLLLWTGFFLLFSCGCCSNQSVFIFSLQKSTFAHGFSRIPGLNGIPEMPGIPDAPGPQGQ